MALIKKLAIYIDMMECTAEDAPTWAQILVLVGAAMLIVTTLGVIFTGFSLVGTKVAILSLLFIHLPLLRSYILFKADQCN